MLGAIELFKIYNGDVALNALNLSIQRGEIFLPAGGERGRHNDDHQSLSQFHTNLVRDAEDQRFERYRASPGNQKVSWLNSSSAR